jgi:hypothetical protein
MGRNQTSTDLTIGWRRTIGKRFLDMRVVSRISVRTLQVEILGKVPEAAQIATS